MLKCELTSKMHLIRYTSSSSYSYVEHIKAYKQELTSRHALITA